MKNKLVSISDIVFTVVLAAAAILVWFFLAALPAGNAVVFRQDGKIVAESSLFANTQMTIKGAYTNIFEIKDGTVRIVFTDCPNHQCEKSGAISADGASIVCAPNHVSATIEETGGEVDAITG